MAYTDVQKLLDKARRETSSICDPIQTAADYAAVVVNDGKSTDTMAMVQALNDAMPASTTVLERGLAIGMAFALKAVGDSE